MLPSTWEAGECLLHPTRTGRVGFLGLGKGKLVARRPVCTSSGARAVRPSRIRNPVNLVLLMEG